MDYKQACFNMVETQLRPWNIMSPQVLKVMGNTPREKFVPESYQKIAYTETRTPLGYGQAMMDPAVEGRLLQALELTKNDHVLEVGTGSGYLTALLVQLAQHVTSLEIIPELSALAAAKLAETDNVSLQEVDFFSLELTKTYDAIVLSGSLTRIPDTLKQWLSVGGRLFVVVGSGKVMTAQLLTRMDKNQWVTQKLFETYLPSLVNAPSVEKFQF